MRRVHAHDLGALVVDGRGVEVVDLDVGVGTHRVRHRARVLGELALAQVAHFLDAHHRARVLVGAVFLVAVDREAFLERELEPVAAGDAVAGPVVEVLVRDHLVDAEVVVVGRGVGAREDVLRVEDVEALVLHRAGVEVRHGDDHEALEVELEAEDLLVPRMQLLSALHREAGLVELAGLDVDLQQRASCPSAS